MALCWMWRWLRDKRRGKRRPPLVLELLHGVSRRLRRLERILGMQLRGKAMSRRHGSRRLRVIDGR